MVEKLFETRLMRAIRVRCSRRSCKLFRNNVGGYQAPNYQWVSYGVGGKGGADLIGWKTVEITPDMVGKKVAIFCAIEVKRPGTDLTEHQAAFIEAAAEAGALAGAAHSITAAKQILKFASFGKNGTQ